MHRLSALRESLSDGSDRRAPSEPHNLDNPNALSAGRVTKSAVSTHRRRRHRHRIVGADHARKESRTLTMEIDHKSVAFPEGVTVHRAAELAAFSSPRSAPTRTSPLRRLPAVHRRNRRNARYPLSCSTAAREGMKVQTDTAALRELRKDILQLILSEHPSSCLICDERMPAGITKRRSGRPRFDRLPVLPERLPVRAPGPRRKARRFRDRFPHPLPRPRGGARRSLL